MFKTGRMALMLKTGVKAFSSAGWVGSEQFTSKAPDRTGQTDAKGWTLFYDSCSYILLFSRLKADRIYLNRESGFKGSCQKIVHAGEVQPIVSILAVKFMLQALIIMLVIYELRLKIYNRFQKVYLAY